MAITNYSELQSAVAGWLNKTNLTARIPDFIMLAEEHFNNEFRLKDMETVTPFTTTGQYTPLPADFLEARAIQYAAHPYNTLDLAPPAVVYRENYGGPPKYFAIRGSDLETFPYGTVDLVLDYYAKIPDLATNDENYLLTSNPSVYLWRACYEGATWLKDAQGMATYGARFDEAAASLARKEKKHKTSGPMVVRPR